MTPGMGRDGSSVGGCEIHKFCMGCGFVFRNTEKRVNKGCPVSLRLRIMLNEKKFRSKVFRVGRLLVDESMSPPPLSGRQVHQVGDEGPGR